MIITLDWETAWSKEYTLSKMTTEEYIRDPRFKAHGVGIKVEGNLGKYYYHPEKIAQIFRLIPWHDTIMINHNAHFDAAILAWHYGIVPKMIVCTRAMGRGVFPQDIASLGNLCKLLGLGEKGHEVDNTCGKWELTEAEQQALGEYCAHGRDSDLNLTWRLFNLLKTRLTFHELQLIDLTVRMFVKPTFKVNVPLLAEAYVEELQRKQQILDSVGYTKKELGSGGQFAAILESLGVEPPTKLSPTWVKKLKHEGIEVADVPEEERKYTYAFGKSDEQFLRLLEHDDPTVAAVVEARLGTKSSITETRTKRFHDIGTRGAFPVYLNYFGAHTGRWSGGDKANVQNLNRGGVLRKALEAPDGMLCLVGDLAQIEARMLAYWAGQWDVVEAFAQGRDVYSEMASVIFSRPVDRKKNPDDYVPGFIGKAVVLGCGYGLGWRKFQQMIRVGMLGEKGILFDAAMAAMMHVDTDRFLRIKNIHEILQETKPLNVAFEDHVIHCATAKHIIDTFRTQNNHVPALWKECTRAIPHMQDHTILPVGEQDMVKAVFGGMLKPNNMMVQYEVLKYHEKTREWSVLKKGFGKRKERQKIYGGLIVENVVQALCRDIIGEQMITMHKEGFHIVTSTHDEIVCVAPEADAPAQFTRMMEIMATPPKWAPGFPIKAEGGFAKAYGDVK